MNKIIVKNMKVEYNVVLNTMKFTDENFHSVNLDMAYVSTHFRSSMIDMMLKNGKG